MDRSAHLSRPYTLDTDSASAYRRDGHVFLPGVASGEEVRHFRPLLTGLADEFARQRAKEGRRGGYGAMFTQATNLWRMNDEARKFVFSERFARIAAELMGVRGVRLYHDQALIKEPGGKPTPWHQDHYYWPLDTEHTITLWMALVDIPPEMGSMSFASGTHHSNVFPPMEISERSQEYFEKTIREGKIPTPSYSLKAGDATFHSGDLLHSAHGNQSPNRREVMTVIYYADGTRIMEPGYEHRRIDMETFHPGLKPGDFAASELNPILFSRE